MAMLLLQSRGWYRCSASLVINSNGNVESVAITNPGPGYTKANVVISQVSGRE